MTYHPWQTTLEKPVRFEGVGVHSGITCHLSIEPAEAGTGIRFVRTDLGGAPQIPAHVRCVTTEPTLRQTVLRLPENPKASVCTVEHFLAALTGVGIDNARVLMDSAEAPILDGSAREAARELRRVGLRVLDGAKRQVLEVRKPLRFSPEDSPDVEYVAWPSQHLTTTYFLDYDHPFIGRQAATCRLSPEVFTEEIAPARTFCTAAEVEYLRAKGLIRGGSLDNALVFADDGPVGGTMHWENEPARHKLLDLIGDLALLGAPLHGHVLAYRAGHTTNARFVEYLRKELEAS